MVGYLKGAKIINLSLFGSVNFMFMRLIFICFLGYYQLCSELKG